MREGIRQLLVADTEARLGQLLWSRLSAVDHAIWWGLAWAFDLSGAESDSAGRGFATVSVGTDSTEVALQAFCILRALRVAATQRVELTGWSDTEWEEASQAAEAHEATLLAAARQ
jgi:hypothetical protein